MLVPRGLCLFESLACAEIRLYELPGFARLQAQRLSPFGRTGASAVRRGHHLMLWLWDADEVEQALQSAGLAGNPRLSIIAEALYLSAPGDSGTSVDRATQCTVRSSCEGGAILQSEVLAPAALDVDVIRPRPWGHNWLANWGQRRQVGARSFSARAFVNLGAACVAGAMFVFMMYQGGALLASRNAAERLATELDASLAERGQTSALSKAVEVDAGWVRNFAQASRQLDVAAFVDAIRPVLERNGVVLGEFEANDSEVRLVAVTVGGEIRLPDLLADLGRIAGVRGVRLMQQDEFKRATFALQTDAFVVALKSEDGGGAHAGQ